MDFTNDWNWCNNIKCKSPVKRRWTEDKSRQILQTATEKIPSTATEDSMELESFDDDERNEMHFKKEDTSKSNKRCKLSTVSEVNTTFVGDAEQNVLMTNEEEENFDMENKSAVEMQGSSLSQWDLKFEKIIFELECKIKSIYMK